MASQRIAGFCFFKIDGAQYPARGDFEYQPLDTSKEGVAGQDGVHGYKEMPVIPHIKGKVTDLGGISVQALQALTDSTVTLELANGKVVILRDAWVKGEIAVNSQDGSYEITLEGKSCIEQVTS